MSTTATAEAAWWLGLLWTGARADREGGRDTTSPKAAAAHSIAAGLSADITDSYAEILND